MGDDDYSFELISIKTYAPQFIRHNKLSLGSVYRIHTFFVNIIPRERHLRHDFYFMKWKLSFFFFFMQQFFLFQSKFTYVKSTYLNLNLLEAGCSSILTFIRCLLICCINWGVSWCVMSTLGALCSIFSGCIFFCKKKCKFRLLSIMCRVKGVPHSMYIKTVRF